jgi:transposase
MIDIYEREVAKFDRPIHRPLKDDAGYQAVQRINGVGKVIAAIFVAEIGDVSRFASPEKLSSWAGLTPKHRESDDTHAFHHPATTEAPMERPCRGAVGRVGTKRR